MIAADDSSDCCGSELSAVLTVVLSTQAQRDNKSAVISKNIAVFFMVFSSCCILYVAYLQFYCNFSEVGKSIDEIEKYSRF